MTVWLAIAIACETNWPIGFTVGTFAALDYGVGRAWAGRRGGPVRAGTQLGGGE